MLRLASALFSRILIAACSTTPIAPAPSAAGVKQQLEKDMKRIAGLRMLDGRFMEINQAMGTAKGRDEGIKYLRAFIEELKASGFVAAALERHHIDGVAVAPPAAR